MKTIIVYFSLTNNTKWVTNQVMDLYPDADCHEIKLSKSKKVRPGLFTTFLYGMRMALGLKMPIQKENIDWSLYDQVIIGSPVWMGKAAPPVKTFLKQHDIQNKKISAFCTSGSGKPGDVFKELSKLLGEAIIYPILCLKEPLTNEDDDNSLKQIEKFVTELKYPGATIRKMDVQWSQN